MKPFYRHSHYYCHCNEERTGKINCTKFTEKVGKFHSGSCYGFGVALEYGAVFGAWGGGGLHSTKGRAKISACS